MMRTTLDPKLDVVFKLLFARPANKRLLISLLTAFLEPASPIVDVEVLNPEVTKETVEDKGTVLDILVKLENGHQVNLEMQTTAQGWSMSRGVFYSSRVFVSQLRKGDGYHELKPVVGIFILDFTALPAARYHSKFELLEVHDHTRLTDDLTLHGNRSAPCLSSRSWRAIWARMSNTKSHQELAERIERLVQEHMESTRTAAKQAVERAFTGTGASPKRAPRSSRSSGTRKRRASSEVAALGERLYKAVCAAPGAPMAVLSREIGASARELHRPMSLLKRSGRVRSVGERHATRYFPRTNGASASV